MYFKNRSFPTRPREFKSVHNLNPELRRRWPCKTPDCSKCEHHFRLNKPLQKDDGTEFFEDAMFYTEVLTNVEARARAKGLLTSANESREALQELMKLHGDLFLSRWKKRSQDKRADLLRLANPNLPERRNFDIWELTQTNGGRFDYTDARNAKFRESLLLPYLGVEALRKDPGLTFALIHHRTSHTFEEWAAFDMHTIAHAWDMGLFDVAVSDLCMVAHGEKYGQLVDFEADAVHRGDLVGFPRAQLLLETQAHLLQFLSRLVELVLEGANLDRPSSTKWTEMCQQGFRASGDVAEWSSYTFQPFSKPPVFDIDDLISTAEMQLDAAADHLILLQTNPVYTRRYIHTIGKGGVSKILSGTQRYGVIDAYIRADVQVAYWWLCVKEELQNVKAIRVRFRDQIQRGTALPPRYDRALASLELVLVKFMTRRAEMTVLEMWQRPGFAEHSNFMADGSTISVDRRVAKQDYFKTDPLWWACTVLGCTPDMPTSPDHASLFAFIEDHLSGSSKTERGRIDEVLLHRYSDLAAYHEVLLKVRWSRPQNRLGSADDFKGKESRRAWQGVLLETGLTPSSEKQTKLLEAFDATDPTERDAVEKRLAEYWAAMRCAIPALTKDEGFEKVFKADLQLAYIQAVKERDAREKIEAGKREAELQKVMKFQDDDSSSKPMSGRTVHTKLKTKGEALAPPENLEAEGIVPTAVEAEVPVLRFPAASKRARDTFGKMFRSDGEARQGCDWATFVHSMRDIGFSVRNGAGSAVIFALGDKGKIAFHRPHPDPQIDRIILQAMGYRLKKWFGLCEESFEPAPPA